MEPLNMSPFNTIIYAVYSMTILLFFHVGYVVSQIWEALHSLNDIKRMSFGLGYIFSDTLGKAVGIYLKAVKVFLAQLS